MIKVGGIVYRKFTKDYRPGWEIIYYKEIKINLFLHFMHLMHLMHR